MRSENTPGQENKGTEKLGSEYDFRFNDSTIDQYVRAVFNARSKGDTDIDSFLGILDAALEERLKVLDVIEAHPDKKFMNSGNFSMSRKSLRETIALIDSAIHPAQKASKQESVPKKAEAVEIKHDLDSTEEISAIDNSLGHAFTIAEKAKEGKDVEKQVENHQYLSIADEIEAMSATLDGKESITPMTKQRVSRFITRQRQRLEVAGEKLDDTKESDSATLDMISEDFKLLDELRLKLKEKKANSVAIVTSIANKKAEVGIKTEIQPVESEHSHLDIEQKFTEDEFEILKSNHELHQKFKMAEKEYNQQIEEGAAEEVKDHYWQKILKLRKDFKEYATRYEIERGKGTHGYGKSEDYADNLKLEDEEGPEDYKTRSRRLGSQTKNEKAEVKKLKAEVEESKKIEAISTQEVAKEDASKPKHLSIGEIFVIDKDYSHIMGDTNFDSWMKKMYQLMVRANEANENNVRNIEDWYQEYKESAIYVAKLETVLKDVKKSAKELDIMAVTEKMDNLTYDLYRNGDRARAEIDTIFTRYDKSRLLRDQRQKLEQFDTLKRVINGQKYSSPGKELKPEQVQMLLESRGVENRGEITREIWGFLHDIQNNYEFYTAGKGENEHNSTLETFTRYIKSSHNPAKPKKIGFFGKAWSKTKSAFTINFNPNELNSFVKKIEAVRKLNLVDRNNGNEQLAKENQYRMGKLIELMEDEPELLNRYLENPDMDLTTIPQEKQELIKTFQEMFKVFSKEKYEGREARAQADELLKYDSNIHSIRREDVTSPKEDFFNTETEMKAFEEKAEYEVSKTSLTELEEGLKKFPKGKKDEKKIRELTGKFNEIEKVLLKSGNDESDKLNLQKTSLKLYELIVRHLDKDNLQGFSESLLMYNKLFNSQEISNNDKISYAKELIELAKNHRNKEGNTLLLNARLDAIIEKYQKVLNSIK